MKKFILLITVMFIFVNAQMYNDRTGGIITEINKNIWQPISFSTVDNEILIVTIKETYFGNEKKYNCKCVFFNGSQYKMVAPWFDSKIINAENIYDIKIEKVKK